MNAYKGEKKNKCLFTLNSNFNMFISVIRNIKYMLTTTKKIKKEVVYQILERILQK